MLRRSTKFQLILFVFITLIGVSYVSAEYVGLTKGLFGSSACTVSADFPDSGGIFSNAEVTYRGVTVGRVGALTITPSGVRVALNLSNCSNPKIPASAAAYVADRSVVGEQYVNLVPPNNAGPYLSSGQIIPASRNHIPVSTQTLLVNLDRFVRSVNTDTLATTVQELGNAFNGKGNDLGNLLDASRELLTAAQQNLPSTLALIDSSSTVLQTQLDEAPALASFSHSLNLLSQQLKTSDGDIRSLLDNGPGDLATIASFVRDNRTDLGVTFANLAASGQLLVRRTAGIREILELYPALAAGGVTVLHPNGIGYLGLDLGLPNDPPDCGDPRKGSQGYQGTVIRDPGNLSPQAPNTSARCNASAGDGTNVRGSQNAPGGDPISTSGGQVAYPRVGTSDTVHVGTTGSTPSGLGDRSWLTFLTNGLH